MPRAPSGSASSPTTSSPPKMPAASGGATMSVTNCENDPCGDHCPFLNRADRRCSDYFHLDRLEHAFAYCFGGYRSCPVYGDLLAERRAWRALGRRGGVHGEDH